MVVDLREDVLSRLIQPDPDEIDRFSSLRDAR